MIEPGSRVAGYARDSGGSRQELSVDQQQAAIAKHCQERGLTLSRLFVDAARSGGAVAGRDQFLQMVDYLQDAPEAGVIIWSYARFARQYDDLQLYTAILRKAGKEVVSLTDPVPEGLEGRLLESIYAYKDAKFRVDLARDVRRGQRYIAEVYHAYPYGVAPMGYLRVPITTDTEHRDGSRRALYGLAPDPETAPVVRQAFEMRADGASYSEIGDALLRWPVYKQVGRLLHNRIYRGELATATYSVEGFCPPIVSDALWLAAQDVNKRRKMEIGFDHPRRVRSTYLLSGLLACAVCGRAMVGLSCIVAGGEYRYYRCCSISGLVKCGARPIVVDQLDQRVLAVVREQALSRQVLDDVAAELARMQVQVDNLAERILQLIDSHPQRAVRGIVSRVAARRDGRIVSGEVVTRIGDVERVFVL